MGTLNPFETPHEEDHWLLITYIDPGPHVHTFLNSSGMKRSVSMPVGMTETLDGSSLPRAVHRSAVSDEGMMTALVRRIKAFSQGGWRKGGGRCRCATTRAYRPRRS